MPPPVSDVARAAVLSAQAMGSTECTVCAAPYISAYWMLSISSAALQKLYNSRLLLESYQHSPTFSDLTLALLRYYFDVRQAC